MDSSEHNSGLGRWQSFYRAADPRLRAWVHGYFASSSRLPAAVRERHLPSTEIPLLLNFGAPHRRLDEDAGEWAARDHAWVVGLHAKHQMTEAVGERHFMVVRFTPLGAHRFLRMPMDLIANRAVDLASIDPALARLTMSRVGIANSWTARFDAMEALIAERVVGEEIPGAVDLVWRELVASHGRASLGTLAAEIDCSHRTLIAKFRTSIGLPPKTVARLMRFNRALATLDELSGTRANEPAGKPYVETAEDMRTGAIAWADLAADCGYFDQAHFIRDFREFAGTTPASFLRRVALLS
jgi:AraC-like DNA-binding protein